MRDLISRQTAIDALNEQIELCDKALSSFDIAMKDEYAVKVERASLVAYKEQLEALPSAQPQRTGRWIEDDDEMFVICSECGEKNDYISAYCPDCGVKMEESSK